MTAVPHLLPVCGTELSCARWVKRFHYVPRQIPRWETAGEVPGRRQHTLAANLFFRLITLQVSRYKSVWQDVVDADRMIVTTFSANSPIVA